MRTLMRWKRLWVEQPERMEQIRRAATKIASQKRQDRNLALKKLITSWPQYLSPDELKQQIETIAPNLNPKSVVNRVRRLGYLTFDPIRGAWTNHTLQTID
jgi:FKBP-type peptidyl-prolyl cis-trans isomerase (trigger factor)